MLIIIIIKFTIAEAQFMVLITFTIVNNNKITIAEAQLMVLITFTIVNNNNNKMYNV